MIHRAGMTMMEVMMALVILSVAVMAMMGNIGTLNQAHQSAKDYATAQQLAQLLVERFQGATWHTLGTTGQPWSLHRRDRTGAPNPPMTDTTTVANNNLVNLGLLNSRSGMTDLKVYVEYYNMAVFQDGAGAWQVNNLAQARTRMADTTMWLAETSLDLRDVTDAIFIRILITWRDVGGGARRHELSFARRK